MRFIPSLEFYTQVAVCEIEDHLTYMSMFSQDRRLCLFRSNQESRNIMHFWQTVFNTGNSDTGFERLNQQQGYWTAVLGSVRRPQYQIHRGLKHITKQNIKWDTNLWLLEPHSQEWEYQKERVFSPLSSKLHSRVSHWHTPTGSWFQKSRKRSLQPPIQPCICRVSKGGVDTEKM